MDYLPVIVGILLAFAFTAYAEKIGTKTSKGNSSDLQKGKDEAVAVINNEPEREDFLIPQENCTGPKIIAVCSAVGGVGKSTTVINLGTALQRLGKRVLIVDLEMSAYVSEVVAGELKEEVYRFLDIINGKCSAEEAITHGKEMDIIPSKELDHSLYEHACDVSMFYGSRTEAAHTIEDDRVKFKKALESITDDYDYVLIDTNPYSSFVPFSSEWDYPARNVHLDMALYAADQVLILSHLTEPSLERTLQFIDYINLGVAPASCGVLSARCHRRVGSEEKILQKMKFQLGSVLFDSKIGRETKLEEAWVARKTIFDHAPDSPAAAEYAQLAEEVVRFCSFQKKM